MQFEKDRQWVKLAQTGNDQSDANEAQQSKGK
jgi:hypothetical protein